MSRKVNISTNTSTPEDEMAAMVAGRIAALRKSRGYTFDELARRAGVSKGTLVQIEQGDANPSISTLCRLASALGASVADLVSTKDKAQSAIVVAGAEQARKLWVGPNGGSGVLLAGTTGPDMLELWHWELQPGERFEASRHNRGTRELIHVTTGKLLLEIDGGHALIGVGATAIANTDRPHAYANPGKSSVRFVMTVHEPAAAA
jgi:transcriptional regulator with XRE-family HTH domain